jgi:murein DD-endopeptidase MepM/ murein hydrolase activator NlpD
MIAVAALAGAMACATRTALAQDMQVPRLSHINPDWGAVAADLDLAPPPSGASSIGDLNRATAAFFPNIAASPVPVQLPFDTNAFLSDRAAGGTGKPVDEYLSGFHLSPFFLPGPAGYDAMFTTNASEMPELGIGFSGRIEVFISGFSLTYDLDPAARITERPVKGADFLGIEHVLLESYARDTFTRYGVPYVVSILCFDGAYSRYRMVSCRDAGKIAERFLKALHVAGGKPASAAPTDAPSTIERPLAQSPDFTFHSPGDIIPGTGMRGHGGRADYTVYSKMRFPLADAPAYANSQSFMNWGNCDSTGRIGVGTEGGIPTYRCRIGGPTLLKDESAGANYAYPWRDNFCEHRYFAVGQCPGGLGHQGQDIRPSSCTQRFVGGSCEPYRHEVVAARDGMVLRSAAQMPVYLFVNAPDEHIRLRYLHMSPRQLDEDGVLSGRVLKQGEAFGKVGSYFQHERATSYHLHFDMQVPTKYGWVLVNPYMTLVAAYERLIGGRGTEIGAEPKEEIVATPALLPTQPRPQVAALEIGLRLPLPKARPQTRIASTGAGPRLLAAGPPHVDPQSEGGVTIEDASHEPDDPLAPDPKSGAANSRLGSGVDGVGTAGIEPGAERTAPLRPMGVGLPRPGDRSGHFRRHLFAGHARPKAGYHRL